MTVLKLLHLLALVAALGAGGARLMAGRRIAAAPDSSAALLPLMQHYAQVNYVGILVLWLTGVPLWIVDYGARLDLGGGFHLKLAAVALLTVLALITYLRAATGRPLPMAVGRHIGLVMLGSGVLAMAGAVRAFGGG